MGKFDVIQWTTKSIANAHERPPVHACFGLYPRLYTANKFIYKAAIIGDDLEKPEVGVVKARRFRPGTERYWQGEIDLNRYAAEMAVLFTDQTLAAKIDLVDQYLAPLHGYTKWDKVCLKMKPRYFRRLLKFEIVLIENVVRDLQLLNDDKILEAFSHFSYSESNCQSLIHSFKGSKTVDDKYLLLTPGLFTHKFDIHRWFQKHTCNNICGKFKRPPDTSYADKPMDIDTDTMFYNFENEIKPAVDREEISREAPKETGGKQVNLETTFGAKSCDGTYSVVTALVHSDIGGKSEPVSVAQNNLVLHEQQNSKPEHLDLNEKEKKPEQFNNKFKEHGEDEVECLDGRDTCSHSADSVETNEYDFGKSEKEDQYLQNAILQQNPVENGSTVEQETEVIETLDYKMPSSNVEYSTLVVRPNPYYCHETDIVKEGSQFLSESHTSIDEIQNRAKFIQDTNLNVQEISPYVNISRQDENMWLETPVHCSDYEADSPTKAKFSQNDSGIKNNLEMEPKPLHDDCENNEQTFISNEFTQQTGHFIVEPKDEGTPMTKYTYLDESFNEIETEVVAVNHYTSGQDDNKTLDSEELQADVITDTLDKTSNLDENSLPSTYVCILPRNEETETEVVDMNHYRSGQGGNDKVASEELEAEVISDIIDEKTSNLEANSLPYLSACILPTHSKKLNSEENKIEILEQNTEPSFETTEGNKEIQECMGTKQNTSYEQQISSNQVSTTYHTEHIQKTPNELILPSEKPNANADIEETLNNGTNISVKQLHVTETKTECENLKTESTECENLNFESKECAHLTIESTESENLKTEVTKMVELSSDNLVTPNSEKLPENNPTMQEANNEAKTVDKLGSQEESRQTLNTENYIFCNGFPENGTDVYEKSSNPGFLAKYHLQDFVETNEKGMHHNYLPTEIDSKTAVSTETTVYHPNLIEKGCKSSELVFLHKKPLNSSLRSGKRKQKGKSVKFADNLNDEKWDNVIYRPHTETSLLEKSPNITSTVTITTPVSTNTKLFESFRSGINLRDPNWYSHIPCECCDNENITGRD